MPEDKRTGPKLSFRRTKHLKFAGVAIVTPAEREISELHVGLKGRMKRVHLATGPFISFPAF